MRPNKTAGLLSMLEKKKDGVIEKSMINPKRNLKCVKCRRKMLVEGCQDK